MAIPLEITSRDFELTPAIQDFITKRVEKLEKFFNHIIGIEVVIEIPHKHQNKGKDYNIRVDIGVPGQDLVIKRQPQEDIYMALRDAFNAAGRLLEDHARKVRGDVKSHEEPDYGKVKTLNPAEGYGFLETPTGLEIYFHRNSVANDGFDRLNLGDKVRYVESMGDKGPQASTVAPA